MPLPCTGNEVWSPPFHIVRFRDRLCLLQQSEESRILGGKRMVIMLFHNRMIIWTSIDGNSGQYRAFRGEQSTRHKLLMDLFKPISYIKSIKVPKRGFYAEFTNTRRDGS